MGHSDLSLPCETLRREKILMLVVVLLCGPTLETLAHFKKEPSSCQTYKSNSLASFCSNSHPSTFLRTVRAHCTEVIGFGIWSLSWMDQIPFSSFAAGGSQRSRTIGTNIVPTSWPPDMWARVAHWHHRVEPVIISSQNGSGLKGP